MKKKLALLCAGLLCLTLGLTACGASLDEIEEAATIIEEAIDEEFPEEAAEEVAEEEVYEEEAVEEVAEFTNISYALAGTVWIDEELAVYGFETDEITCYMAGPDGTQYVGEYLLEASPEGDTYLSFYIPDLDVQISAYMTAIAEDHLEFEDLETGAVTYLVPVA